MARSRNIKPSFFQNDYLVELPFETRLLFIGLWTLADREGRLENRPKKIKMELFPADNIDISKSVKELCDNGFLTVYQSNGASVIQIINFKKHQSPHGTEKDSLLPDSNNLYTVNERRNGLATGKFTLEQVIDNAIVSSHTVKEPLSNVNLPSHNALNPECGILNPECGILNVESTKPVSDANCERKKWFDCFWLQYPTKTNKQAAVKAWMKLKMDESLYQQIMVAVAKQKNWQQWQEGFIPHAATWLNGKRWEDVEPVRKNNGGGGDMAQYIRETSERLRKQDNELPIFDDSFLIEDSRHE